MNEEAVGQTASFFYFCLKDERMTALIIEDEALAADTLSRMLLDINPNIQILDVLGTVEAAVQWLSRHKAELIFMDIHLGDGESFQIFRQIDVQSPVIFTTAYDQYTLKAFKNQGIDYLLKPFEEDDLRAALLKLYNIRRIPAGPAEKHNDPGRDVRNRFMVKSGRLIKSIRSDDIAYFMAEDKYLFLVSHQGQQYIIDETVANLEPQLDQKTFYRINRKFIINIKAIREMYTLSRNRIRIILDPVPTGATDVIVSEERAESFKAWLNH
ncbi:LytR/AlgR family response regulator transcription factor [Pedobacter deserti]|uniref:LytR/AlgR family response regulator transcription factor n=1 Tax=Pedobacter deserti TaxID=2817382 RepID=UPI002109E037|nr:LytTR family DNA-binding domain-containing protein [Pedobacter sp. SYSU D00382]